VREHGEHRRDDLADVNTRAGRPSIARTPAGADWPRISRGLLRGVHSIMKKLMAALVTSFALTTFAVAPAAAQQKDIVDTAIAAGSFTTLVKLVQQAGLVETLKGPGPFTVFAPTDEAFSKVPKETLAALGADKEKLRAVLTYHVVPGKVMAADVVKVNEAKTVQGQSVKVRTSGGSVKIDEANVVKTDIQASNGVIHVIDSVIIPN
jgi:uncharacterized surface protein with fasciclin (FAS1) repeats